MLSSVLESRGGPLSGMKDEGRTEILVSNIGYTGRGCCANPKKLQHLYFTYCLIFLTSKDLRRAWPKTLWSSWVTAAAALKCFTGFETRGSYSPLGKMALLHCCRITYLLLECEGPFTKSHINCIFLNKTKQNKISFISYNLKVMSWSWYINIPTLFSRHGQNQWLLY